LAQRNYGEGKISAEILLAAHREKVGCPTASLPNTSTGNVSGSPKAIRPACCHQLESAAPDGFFKL